MFSMVATRNSHWSCHNNFHLNMNFVVVRLRCIRWLFHWKYCGFCVSLRIRYDFYGVFRMFLFFFFWFGVCVCVFFNRKYSGFHVLLRICVDCLCVFHVFLGFNFFFPFFFLSFFPVDCVNYATAVFIYLFIYSVQLFKVVYLTSIATRFYLRIVY